MGILAALIMLSSVAVVNLTILVVTFLGLALLAPFPSTRWPAIFRDVLDAQAVPRRFSRLLGIVLVVGTVGPAIAGWAPRATLNFDGSRELLRLVYPGFFLVGVCMVTLSVGVTRIWRIVRSATVTGLETPPDEGPAVVAATVGTLPDETYASVDDVPVVAYDYRSDPVVASEAADRVADVGLCRYGSFRLEGPGGTVHVDTEGAHLWLGGDYAEECRIYEGSTVTVVGTVRWEAGRHRMSGRDGLLFVTNETPDELRARLRKQIVLVPVLGVSLSAVAAWILYVMAF